METGKYKAKISPRNKEFADRIEKLAKTYSIIGVVDVSGLPAPQFQRIRSSLKSKAEVLIVKKNIIELVLSKLESDHKGIRNLMDSVHGIIGLIFTNSNPFTIYKFVKKNKSSAPARAGQIAPTNIVVPAGPTGFAPGPIIGELGSFKIKAGINAGKVEIKEDCIVAKEGDVISSKLAGILARLQIEPMEVGLNIKSIYEAGTIYRRNVLDIDDEAILSSLKSSALDCFKLSIGINYFTKENIKVIIGNAGKSALGLGVGIDYISKDTVNRLFAKANSQMLGVANVLPTDLRPAGLSFESVAQEVSSANEVPKAEESGSSNDASSKDVDFSGFF